MDEEIFVSNSYFMSLINSLFDDFQFLPCALTIDMNMQFGPLTQATYAEIHLKLFIIQRECRKACLVVAFNY